MNYPYDMYTAQSGLQPAPLYHEAAANMNVVHKFMLIQGVVPLVNLIPPDPGGYCEVTLCYVAAAPGAFSVAGNLNSVYQPIQNRPIDLCYEPAGKSWYVKATV